MIPGIQASNFPSLPFPWHFVISLPVPRKRKFWPGIKTENTLIICSFADGWSRHENKSNLEFNLSRSLPVKRECDFQFSFPFPGAKKPFPLTPVVGDDRDVKPLKDLIRLLTGRCR